MKKYFAILALVIVAVMVGAVLLYGNDYKHEDRPVIVDLKKHNEVMSACMKTALAKHPGDVISLEAEIENGLRISDLGIKSCLCRE